MLKASDPNKIYKNTKNTPTSFMSLLTPITSQQFTSIALSEYFQEQYSLEIKYRFIAKFCMNHCIWFISTHSLWFSNGFPHCVGDNNKNTCWNAAAMKSKHVLMTFNGNNYIKTKCQQFAVIRHVCRLIFSLLPHRWLFPLITVILWWMQNNVGW